jgi:hypothetical protein
MDAKIEQWQEVISQWRESGQTQKDFCRTRDIKLSTLHYWMKRVKKTSTAQAALPGLVRIAPPATSGGSTEIIIEIDRRFRILVPDGFSGNGNLNYPGCGKQNSPTRMKKKSSSYKVVDTTPTTRMNSNDTYECISNHTETQEAGHGNSGNQPPAGNSP